VRGALPVFFAASRENEIRRALAIGKEFGLDLTIVGAAEGFRAVDALTAARKPVVVAVDFPVSPQTTGWAYRQSQRRAPNDSAAADSAVQKVLQGNAAALQRAGVRFALASGGLRPDSFLTNVRLAIAAGLPRATALEALTIRAAEVAGAGRQLGSLEAGKIANLVVTEGDLLGDSAKVRQVFVDGERYEVIETPRPPRSRNADRPGGRTPASTPSREEQDL
jgi:imidazolonepropionase-like amidohydrolase